MTLHLETKRKISEAIEPSKKWRTKWVVVREFVCVVTREHIRKDAIIWGRMVWPSKDLAEQAAIDYDRETVAKYGWCPCDFIGAFPIEGEAP